MAKWGKSILGAVAGGALTAISASVLDRATFNLRDGIADEVVIALVGAIIGLTGMLLGEKDK